MSFKVFILAFCIAKTVDKISEFQKNLRFCAPMKKDGNIPVIRIIIGNIIDFLHEIITIPHNKMKKSVTPTKPTSTNIVKKVPCAS